MITTIIMHVGILIYYIIGCVLLYRLINSGEYVIFSWLKTIPNSLKLIVSVVFGITGVTMYLYLQSVHFITNTLNMK